MPGRTRKTVWILAPLLVIGVLQGCASRPDCRVGLCDRPDHAIEEGPVCESSLQPMMLEAPAAERNVLFLSGGGSRGAFGAGFLAGWTESGTRPDDFDVVTGISTGALQATFAFLGKDYDSNLRIYRTIENKDIYRKRFPQFLSVVALLWSPSTRTTGPLRSLLEQELSDDIIDSVAAEHPRRLLCVGSVNMDTGKFVAWDLTQIAADGDYDKYRSAVLASASMPIVFPPEYINGFPHVDGGVREQVFARTVLESLTSTHTALELVATDNAYFLLNGKLAVTPKCTKPRGADYIPRTLDILVNEGKYGAMYKALQELGGSWEFNLQYIADDVRAGDSMQFDPAIMGPLYETGKTLGTTGRWYTRIPAVGNAPPECD